MKHHAEAEVLENREHWLADFRAGWLAYYQQTGESKRELYVYARNKVAPAGPGIDLSAGRLMLVTSSGAYLADQQPPFDSTDLLGDYTIRRFPASTPLGNLAYAHGHYDHAAVKADPQVLVPLRHLEDLVAEGVIGELAPSVVSFMGYQRDLTRVVDETTQAVLEVAKEEGVRAALLVPA